MDMVRFALWCILKDHKPETLAPKIGNGVHPTTLRRWADQPDEENKHSHIPLPRVAQITHITNDTRLISAITADNGGLFVPGRQLVEGKFKSEKVAIKEMKASADLIASYAAALEDGKVTTKEYRKIAREAMRVHLATAAIVESTREKAGL